MLKRFPYRIVEKNVKISSIALRITIRCSYRGGLMKSFQYSYYLADYRYNDKFKKLSYGQRIASICSVTLIEKETGLYRIPKRGSYRYYQISRFCRIIKLRELTVKEITRDVNSVVE